MEALFLLCGLIALIWVVSLNSRVGKLEKMLRNGCSPEIPKPPSISISTGSTEAEPLPAAVPIPQPVSDKPSAVDALVRWLANDWYLKLGALFMLLAAVWFVSYAFMNNWIGPFGRIALGFIAGALVMIFAQWWQKRSITQATVLYGLGAGVILVTTYAARNTYDMFTPATALAGMFLVALTVAVSSALANSQVRAVLSVILAAFVPFLINSKSEDYFGLLQYALVITISFICLIFWKRWHAVLYVLAGVILIFTLPKIGELASLQRQLGEVLNERKEQSMYSNEINYKVFRDPDPSGRQLQIVRLQSRLLPYQNLWMYLASFSMLLFIGGLYLLSKERKITPASLIFMVALALYVIGWIYGAVALHLQGLVAVAASLIYIALAFMVIRQRESRKEAVVLLFVALGLLAAAAAFMLDGPVLTLALIVLVATYVAGSTWLLGANQDSRPLGLLFSLTSFLMWPHLFGRWPSNGVPWEDWVVIVAYSLSLMFVLYLWKYVWQAGEAAEKLRWLSTYYLTLLAVGMIFWVRYLQWLMPTAQTSARAIALTTFALLGITFYLRGRLKNGPVMRWTGIGLVGGVTVWLLLVETMEMALSVRIVTFFLVGGLFVGVALLEKKFFPQTEKLEV